MIAFSDFLRRKWMLFRKVIWERMHPASVRENAVRQFHTLYYYDGFHCGRTWAKTTWLGVPLSKCPLDLWVYQEILVEVRPDLIIECGTAQGGSALFLASICDLLGNGAVLTIDVQERADRPRHPRIEYILGSSTDQVVIERVKRRTAEHSRIMVMLDSNHSKEHVLSELEIYSKFVSRDSYLIIEDTNLNGHPVCPDHGPGPAEAVSDFVHRNSNFVVDNSREKYYLTFNPGGFLKRIR